MTFVAFGLAACERQAKAPTQSGEPGLADNPSEDRPVSQATMPPVTGPSVVSRDGGMRMPSDYRTRFQYLGAWTVAFADGEAKPGAGPAKEIHTVYASPGVIDAYRKTRRFPEGAILVKEVFHGVGAEMTTGQVSSAGDLVGWFLMVKDSKGRYPGNKLWGDGWGWAWFDADRPLQTTTVDYKAECLGCHVPAKANDWVYVNGYPPLGATAKPAPAQPNAEGAD